MLRYLTYPLIYSSGAAAVILLPTEYKYLGLILCFLLSAFLPTPISLKRATELQTKREESSARRINAIHASPNKLSALIARFDLLCVAKAKPANKYIGVMCYKFARPIPTNPITAAIFLVAASIATYSGFWLLIDSALVDMTPLGGYEHDYEVSGVVTMWSFAVCYLVATTLRNENVALSFMFGFTLSFAILALSKDVELGIIEAQALGGLLIPLAVLASKFYMTTCVKEREKISFNPKPSFAYTLISYVINCIILTLIAASFDLTNYESPHARALSTMEGTEVNVYKPEYLMQMKNMSLAQSDYTPSYPYDNVPLNSILPTYAAIIETPKAEYIERIALPLFIYGTEEDFTAHLNVVAHALKQLNWSGIHQDHEQSIESKDYNYYKTLDIILFDELVQAVIKGSKITVHGVIKAHYDTITDTDKNLFPMKGKTDLNSNLKLTSNMLAALRKFDGKWGVKTLLPKRAKGSIAVAQTRPDFQEFIDFVIRDTKYLHDNIMNITLKSEQNRKAIGGTSKCSFNGWACLPNALNELYGKKLRELASR